MAIEPTYLRDSGALCLQEMDICRLCKEPLEDDEGIGIVGKKSVHWVHYSCRRRYLQKKRKRRRKKG